MNNSYKWNKQLFRKRIKTMHTKTVCLRYGHCADIHSPSIHTTSNITGSNKSCLNRILTKSLGATARSYRRQDGADAAARFEKFLPARASLRPPISLKFTTEKHESMVHPVPKRQTRTLSHFCTIIPERFAARRR